jgi:Putative Flp pilus-assembly TadE/G-like
MRRHHERGQTLVLIVLLLTALLGMVGLAVDVGVWYVTRQKAQAAADFAALAAASDLPRSPGSASPDAVAQAGRNLTGAVVTTTTPYDGSASRVLVRVQTTAPSGFLQVLGFGPIQVSASAVAEADVDAQPYAVFAYDAVCGGGSTGFFADGNNTLIEGAVHSNGALGVNGNNNVFDATSSGGPRGCAAMVNGSNNRFAGAAAPVTDSTLEPWPLDYSTATLPCTYTASSFLFNTNNATLPSGVYCATGGITLNGNYLTGNVTFIAQSVMLNGNNYTLTPYAQNLLIYQKGTGQFTLNGNSYAITGTIFVPSGTLVVNGNSGLDLNGFLEGLNVLMNGNNWTSFTGNGPPGGGTGAALVG